MIRPLIILFLFLSPLVYGEGYKIEKKEHTYEISTRGTAVTLKSLGLMTPGHWLPISYIVDDGSYVKKGEVVARFDSSNAEYELQTLLFEQKVIEQQLKYDINEIDNDRLSKEDKLDGIVDKLNIAIATLNKYKQLPLKDEVMKSEGRLRIAQLEHEASEKEFAKAEDRFKRKFISQAELDAKSQELKKQKVSLEYAVADLEYEKLPATESTLIMAGLEIENLKLEKKDIDYELKELSSLQDIEKTLATHKKTMIEKKLKNQRRDLEKTSVKAPESGYVKHMSYGSEKLGPGSKYFRGYRFADIPDLKSIVFEVYIPEKNRKFFAQNDKAQIYINGLKGKSVEGYIHQIYDVPIDIGEKHDLRYGATAELTGLKVYRAEIKPRLESPWLILGMNGTVKLISSRKYKLPALPVKYLHLQEEKKYLAYNGVYKEVSGFMNQGFFFIEASRGEGLVSLDGKFPHMVESEEAGEGQSKFMTSGEVVPTKSVRVMVPSIGSSRDEAKITWMKEEESEVKKGDKILQLDIVEAEKSIAGAETRVADVQNQVDKLKKKLDLEKRENVFMIQTQKNKLKIKEIQRDIRLLGLDYKAAISARLRYLQAKIDYEDSVSELARLKAKNPEFISKVEFEKAERNKQRKVLQLELAKINFDEQKRGATDVEKSAAKRDFVMQSIAYEKYVKNASYKEESMGSELKRLLLRLKEYKFSLKEHIARKDNHTLTAPADGLIRYEKVYDNGRIQKISLGVGLRSKMTAMTLPDLSSLTVAVKVPERYFSKVKKDMLVEIYIPSVNEKSYKGVVQSIDYLFESLSSQDSKIGIYSSQEPLGQNVFLVKINIDMNGSKIKPGVIADIYFPFMR